MENEVQEKGSWYSRCMNHKYSSLFIALVVLAVATVIAFWMTAPVEKKSQQTSNQEMPAAQESNDEDYWRTFTSSIYEYGFEIKHPNNWSVKQYAYPIILIVHENEKDFIKISPTNVPEEYAFDTEDPICDIETITFAGKTAKECRTAAQIGDYRYLRIINPGQAKWGVRNELSYTVFESGREYADKILSTFKFIDSKNDPTASWTTYLVGQYGFEFKYPAELFEDGADESNGAWFEINMHDKVDRQRIGFSVYVNHPGLGFGGSEVLRTTANVDGIKADKVVMEETEGHEQGFKTVVYTFTHDENEYMIVGRGITSNDQADEIVSTFKFRR